ncbi:flavodoxin domain-containing protein [Arcticibacter sp. MXS-1]|uniref:flavodoxin domain-containing protein n=1 Tax=Arcticibacter sp. MXS-1 TaxID=3341726 RepID=UPI0035A95B72
MKTAIVYCSKNGSTEKVAKLIGYRLEDYETGYFDLMKCPNPDIRDYDRVIIGGPIYFGMIQNPVKVFCKQNEKLLLDKELGLFICCILKGQEDVQFESAFSTKLRNHSKARAFLGGELMFEKLNFFEKLMVWKVAESPLEFHIDVDAVDNFVNKMETGTASYSPVL